MNIQMHKASALITSLALLFSAMPAIAEQSADMDDRFSVSLGMFFTDRDSRMSLDGEVPNSGTDIDLEGDLGLDSSGTVFRMDGYFRFNERHRIDFSAFDLSRNGSKQIDEELVWDGEIYPIDVLIKSSFDMSIYKLAYTWSFMQRDNGYLGATAGLHIVDIGTSISAESIGQSSRGGATAPLPVFGLRGQYDFSEKWSLRGSAEFFVFEYENYSGSLHDIYAGIDYQFSRHVAFGVGINIVGLNVGVAETNFDGDLKWRYGGGLLFLKFDF